VGNKNLLATAFIIALFLSAIAEANFVKNAKANPSYEFVSPPAGATPLEISVSSPKNNTIYNVNDITFTFNITTQNTSINSLLSAYYKADWLQDNVTVYEQDIQGPEFPKFWDYSETFRDMPDGKYSIVTTALGSGGYFIGLVYYFFHMATVSVMKFTVDTTPPDVSIFSPLNGTYGSPDVQLNFTVSEKPSLIKYSLDGQKNSTLYGNTTFTDLPVAGHNLTLYVWDIAGNFVSKSVTFNIAKPEPEAFPTMLIAGISVGITVVAGVGLLVYFKRRKK
jgi:hypothetical protein